MEEEELRYYMVLENDKFVGFVSGKTLEIAKEKCKFINSDYYIEGDYVLKPKR